MSVLVNGNADRVGAVVGVGPVGVAVGVWVGVLEGVGVGVREGSVGRGVGVLEGPGVLEGSGVSVGLMTMAVKVGWIKEGVGVWVAVGRTATPTVVGRGSRFGEMRSTS